MGYTLSDDTSQECFFYLTGSGSNGKGTFSESIINALECETDQGYKLATYVGQETFKASSRNADLRPDLTRLKHVKLAYMDESGDHSDLGKGKLVEVTGKGKGLLVARTLNSEHDEGLQPSFKLWLDSNYAPYITGNTYRFERRLKLIDFPHRYVTEEFYNPTNPNYFLKDDTLKASFRSDDQKEAIFLWVVQGAVDYFKNGLGELDGMAAELKKLFFDNDYVKQWLADCNYKIDASRGDRYTEVGLLYLNYRDYMINAGLNKQVMGQISLVNRLKELGAFKNSSNDRVQINGVRKAVLRGIWVDNSPDDLPFADSRPKTFNDLQKETVKRTNYYEA